MQIMTLGNVQMAGTFAWWNPNRCMAMLVGIFSDFKHDVNIGFV